MVNAPQLSLKVIVFVHFILTVWASMVPNYLGISYTYMNGFILAFGVWAIVCSESTDAVFSFMTLNLISIVMDIIFLSVFTSKALSVANQTGYYTKPLVNFCLAMAIINLLLKPFTSFIVYRIYQDRGGQYGQLNIPGIPAFGGNQQGGTGYENIDQSVPASNVETASPHTYDSKPVVP